MGLTLEQFIQQVTQHGLVTAGDISSLRQHLPPARQPKDAESLASELVNVKKLTRYQAAAVTQGKAKNLLFDEYLILDKLGQGGWAWSSRPGTGAWTAWWR
jgi:eukaryotic-like serine/threonine-protein kinase